MVSCLIDLDMMPPQYLHAHSKLLAYTGYVHCSRIFLPLYLPSSSFRLRTIGSNSVWGSPDSMTPAGTRIRIARVRAADFCISPGAACLRGLCSACKCVCVLSDNNAAQAESRTRVTSMGGLYDTATLHALVPKDTHTRIKHEAAGG